MFTQRQGVSALDEATLAFLAAVVVIGLSLVVLSGYHFLAAPNTRWIPRAGKAPGWFGLANAKRDFIENGAKIIDQGYLKYKKDSAFLVQTADMERIVLSPKYLHEIRTAPESVLSLREGMSQRHLGKFTTLDVILTSHLQSSVCKTQLTQNLHALITPMNEEAQFWLAQRIPIDKPSSAVLGHNTLLGVVAGISSRVLVGLPMGRDQDWLRTVVGYTIDVMQASAGLRPYPTLLRPLVAPWLGCIKRLQRHLDTAHRCFGDVFAQRLADPSRTEGEQNVIQWMAEAATGDDRNPEVLVKKLLFITLAAVHTSTMAATHALFDLCVMPEYMPLLRKELDEVIAKHGWTLAAINNMPVLDSFLKESQRINHPGLLSFNRKVLQPLRLSDGTVIPAGSFISMATSSIARDPEHYPEPERFDGLRFYNMRKASNGDSSKRHQFVSTGPENLAFGFGKFACPGRFFAAAQIKVIIATIILRYDVSFPDGQKTRPRNTFVGESIGPDRRQVIVFRRRSDV